MFLSLEFKLQVSLFFCLRLKEINDAGVGFFGTPWPMEVLKLENMQKNNQSSGNHMVLLVGQNGRMKMNILLLFLLALECDSHLELVINQNPKSLFDFEV